MAVQPCLCGTWSETPKTSFLTTRLIQSAHCALSNIATTKQSKLILNNLKRINHKNAYIIPLVSDEAHMSPFARKPVSGVSDQADGNLAVQSQKMVRGLKFRILEV